MPLVRLIAMNKDQKEQKQDDLDTETTFADMNVEGFRWYDPSKKKGGDSKEKLYLSPKERRAIVWAGFLASLPVVACVAVAFLLMFLLAMLWLG